MRVEYLDSQREVIVTRGMLKGPRMCAIAPVGDEEARPITAVIGDPVRHVPESVVLFVIVTFPLIDILSSSGK